MVSGLGYVLATKIFTKLASKIRPSQFFGVKSLLMPYSLPVGVVIKPSILSLLTGDSSIAPFGQEGRKIELRCRSLPRGLIPSGD